MENNGKKLIGYWGYPNPAAIASAKMQYPNCEFLDLDVDYGNPSSNILPDAYCKIIRNIVDNAFFLKDKLAVILASVGREKCDSGFFASRILKDMDFNIVESVFENYNEEIAPIPVSTSNLPLSKKINLITNNIVFDDKQIQPYVKPKFGFWGVPPNDFSFLNLFPNNTHLYGWLRCVESKRPADLDLEMYVDDDVPTVFFAQAFCAKMQLAKYLAKKHGGLYIDIDDVANKSIMAKVEAFIKLR